MPVSVLRLYLQIPESQSLKEKRGRIKPLLARLHREFNVSAAEVDLHDRWRESIIECAIVSNDAVHNQKVLQQIERHIEQTWPDLTLIDSQIESL